MKKLLSGLILLLASVAVLAQQPVSSQKTGEPINTDSVSQVTGDKDLVTGSGEARQVNAVGDKKVTETETQSLPEPSPNRLQVSDSLIIPEKVNSSIGVRRKPE